MKRLLISATLLLSLTACAPALQTAQRESASLKLDGASMVFINPGPDTATAPALLLGGTFETADPNCAKRASGYVGCKLPDTPAGQLYRVRFTGSVTNGSITFYRASAGVRPIYLRLP